MAVNRAIRPYRHRTHATVSRQPRPTAANASSPGETSQLHAQLLGAATGVLPAQSIGATTNLLSISLVDDAGVGYLGIA